MSIVITLTRIRNKVANQLQTCKNILSSMDRHIQMVAVQDQLRLPYFRVHRTGSYCPLRMKYGMQPIILMTMLIIRRSPPTSPNDSQVRPKYGRQITISEI
jgi:hypothetical protein